MTQSAFFERGVSKRSRLAGKDPGFWRFEAIHSGNSGALARIDSSGSCWFMMILSNRPALRYWQGM